jgi:CubicO group peptidase (beta-lactamase class C family)
MMKASLLREGTPEDAGFDPVRIRRLRELIGGWIKNDDSPSVAALVARRGVIVFHEAFGARCHGDRAATLKPNSIFPISSCSKPITAAAVMCLVEDGLIGLNRPVIDYIPELDVPDVQWLEEARVADLLCHTSGIDDLKLSEFIAAAAQRSPELAPPAPGQHPVLSTRIQLAAGAPLVRRPGTAMLYSNFGYNLLGDIVRRVSGVPFWQFVRSRLFEPMGMHDSYFVLPPELRERRVYRAPGMPATEPTPTTRGIDSPEHDEIDAGAGGVASTARDLGTFLQMLLNHGSHGGRQILSHASVAAMTRQQLEDSIPALMPTFSNGKRVDLEFRGGAYGYGLFIFAKGDRFGANGSLNSLSAFGHAGYGGAFMWADPEREVVGIYLSVSPKFNRQIGAMNSDLFQNVVNAAIID